MRFSTAARVAVYSSTLAILAACSSGAPGSDDGAVQGTEELNEKKALGMTDVTILWPLPKTMDQFDDLLAPSSEGDQGELLPADLFAQLAPLPSPPMITFDGKPQDPKRALFADWADSFSLLRVVGVRLDPCFGQSQNMGASSCMNTVRLTAQFFQPRQAGSGNNANIDARGAIHLFYQVTRADFTALSKALLALRLQSGLPLQKGLIGSTNGVHPTMAAEGVRGPYATALKDLLLKYAGAQTLVQVAFCVEDRSPTPSGYYNQQQGQPDARWVFGRYEVKGGRIQPLPIASLDYTGLQTVDSTPSPQNRDAVVVTPASKVQDNFLQMFNRKTEANGQLDPAKMEAARVASIKLQNPLSYAASTADCASCHMAKQATPEHGADPNDFKSYTYRLDHTHDLVGPFRMFGYDAGQNPIVARRVVNETAVVLDYLNSVVLR